MIDITPLINEVIRFSQYDAPKLRWTGAIPVVECCAAIRVTALDVEYWFDFGNLHSLCVGQLNNKEIFFMHTSVKMDMWVTADGESFAEFDIPLILYISNPDQHNMDVLYNMYRIGALFARRVISSDEVRVRYYACYCEYDKVNNKLINIKQTNTEDDIYL